MEPFETLPRPGHPTPLAEPRPPRSPCRTWCNNGGTLVEAVVEPSQTTPDHPAALAEPGGTLVENPCGALPQTTPDHPQPSQNLVEPLRNYLKPPLQNLVKPWWNCRGTLPQTTPDHPTALAWNSGGTLVEPCLKPPQTTPQLSEP